MTDTGTRDPGDDVKRGLDTYFLHPNLLTIGRLTLTVNLFGRCVLVYKRIFYN